MKNKKEAKKWWERVEVWKRVGITLLIGAVLVGAWITFLWIVKDPPLETIPAMIMIWISFAVVIFTLFPSLLNNIKRIKIKDFELELQESIAKASSFDYLYIVDGPAYHVTRKSGFQNFALIFLSAKINPEKPILLIVNVSGQRNISITALFIYLYFLDLYNSNVVCLFVNRKDSFDNWRDISEGEVIGVVEGKKALQSLLSRFPGLMSIVTKDGLGLSEEMDFFDKQRLANFFRLIFENRENIERPILNNIDILSEHNVRNYFKRYLNEVKIKYETSKVGEKSILNAFIKQEKYLTVFKENKLYSVIPLELISNDISKKVLHNMFKEKDDK